MSPRVPIALDLPEVTVSEEDGVRYLHLGTPWIQGAMRVRQPLRVELDYVQRMMASLLWIPPEELGEGVAVQLGLGAAAITRFTHRVLGMPTVAVELNPAVIRACRHFFALPRDGDGLEIVQADAGAWLREPGRQDSTRLLHVDLYDHEAAAPVLDDEAFYADCRSLLEPGGVLSVNLFGREASFDRSLGRIAGAFGGAHVCSLRPTREGNTVVVAARDAPLPPREVLLERAAAIESRFGGLGLPARKWPRMLRPLTAVSERRVA